MKAMLGDTVLAEADKDALVRIEGNWYFPRESLVADVDESSTAYTCAWKGDAQYFHVDAGEERHEDLAWSYPTPLASALARVGTDFSGYVAFDRSVSVVD